MWLINVIRLALIARHQWYMVWHIIFHITGMKKDCAPACLSCDFLVFEARCPMDVAKLDDVWKPGDLNTMFEKLTREPYLSQYSVQTLSSPAHGGPWVVQLDNVLTKEEADQLIDLGGK